jgi:hypothetical protein
MRWSGPSEKLRRNEPAQQATSRARLPVAKVIIADRVHAARRVVDQFITVGASMLPIAGYRFSLNAPSSAGASVTFVALQSGVG